eukprot:g2350.t1
MELEFQNLKNQDITIRQLQTRNRELEVEMEERIADTVAVRSGALKTELDAERSKVQQELEVMQQNVDVVKASESESRERADEAQMEALAAKRQLDEARAKWKAEEESLLEEIERETGKTRQLHAQLEKLKVERDATQRRAQESVSDGEKGRDLEREVNRLRAALQSARASEEERAAGLEDKLLAAQRRAEEMQKSFHERIETMRSEKEQVSADLADTKSELEKILAVRFGSDATGTRLNAEAAMANKLGQLENTCTQLRLQVVTLEDSLRERLDELKMCEADLVAARKEITSLEADLELQDATYGVGARSSRSPGDAVTNNDAANAQSGGHRHETTDFLRSAVSSATSPLRESNIGAATNETAQQSASTPIIPSVIKNQRDRLKQKLIVAEGKIASLEKQLRSTELQARHVSADNEELYKKLKFSRRFKADDLDSAESGVSGDVEYRYERAYAAKLDPFSRFRKEERRKRYDNLNPADKAILLGGKFFMSNRYTRAFLFAYIIFLHITMFLTLHHSIHSHHLAHVKCATSSGAAAGAFPKIK